MTTAVVLVLLNVLFFPFPTATLISYNNITLNKCSPNTSMVIIPDGSVESWKPPEELRQPPQEIDGLAVRSVFETWLDFYLREYNVEDDCENSFRVELYEKDLKDGIKSEIYFTPDGYFRKSSVYYPPESYCILSALKTEVKIAICPPTTGNATLVPKCCPLGSVIQRDLTKSIFAEPECVPVDLENQWTPIIQDWKNTTSDNGTVSELEIITSSGKYIYQQGFPTCEYRKLAHSPHPLMNEILRSEFGILQNGKIFTRPTGSSSWGSTKEGKICIDGLLETSASTNFTPSELNQVYFECYEPKTFLERNRDVIFITVVVTRFAASLLLLITVILHLLVWNKLNVHGWTIAGYCFVVSVEYFCFGLALAILLFKDDLIGSVGCFVISILHHFCDVSAFCWLTVLSYDMWATFTSMTSRSFGSRGSKRFLAYSLVAFGVPFVLVGSFTAIDFFMSESVNFIRPGYGQILCLINVTSVYYYVTIPDLILFTINLIFGSLCVRHLCLAKSALKGADSRNTKQKGQLSLLLKLSFILGLSIFFELISELIPGEFASNFGLFLIFINLLRGFALFWVFTFTRKLQQLLIDNYSLFRKVAECLHCGNTSQQRNFTTKSTATITSTV